MNSINKKRLDELISLNVEGLSSKEEDQALWHILQQQPDERKRFFESREINYLLRKFFDDPASEKGFTNRIMNALNPDRMGNKAFVAAVQNRIDKTIPLNLARSRRLAGWRIAASIILLISGTLILNYKIFWPISSSTDQIATSDAVLVWQHPLEIKQLKNKMDGFYGIDNKHIGYFYSQSRIGERVKRLADQITQVEMTWSYNNARKHNENIGESL